MSLRWRSRFYPGSVPIGLNERQVAEQLFRRVGLAVIDPRRPVDADDEHPRVAVRGEEARLLGQLVDHPVGVSIARVTAGGFRTSRKVVSAYP